MEFALQAAGFQPAFAASGGELDPKRLNRIDAENVEKIGAWKKEKV